jgi:urea transport system permease protein
MGIVALLPDFLLFMGQAGFPSWWTFADSWLLTAAHGCSRLLTAAAVLVVPALVAFGFVSFRSRVNGVYFSIITQTLTYTAMLLMFRNNTEFGGNNGMTGFRGMAGLAAGNPAYVVLLATLSIAAVLLALLGRRALLATRSGRLLTAIRGDEPRLRFLGYETLWIKLAAWCLSASAAAVAGALLVLQVGIINPSLLDPALSLEVAVWVAIGGRGGIGYVPKGGTSSPGCRSGRTCKCPPRRRACATARCWTRCAACSPCCGRCGDGAAATCPAASSSLPSAAP